METNGVLPAAGRGENGRGLLSRWYPETLAQRLVEIQRHADKLIFREGDGMELLPSILRERGKNATVFADPPYTAGGKRAGRRLYTDNDIDHEVLFSMLAESDAEFLMTYDLCPKIVFLVCKHRFAAVVVTVKNTHHNRLPEVVITRESTFE